MTKRPIVGLAILVVNDKGQVLVGKRIGSHAQKYSIFGGALEQGESFEAGAIREAKEELGIEVTDLKVIGVTNNLETYREEGFHSISLVLLVKAYEGEPKIMEPDKCADMLWVDPRKLPQPHFDASRLAVECYLDKKFYVGISK